MDAALSTEGFSPIDRAVAAAKDTRDVVKAAGGVVVRHTDGQLEIALVHRPAYDDWSLPKGKIKDGERLEAAALREVQEETGLSCLIERSLGPLEYVDRKGRDKVVWYWLMRPLGGEFKAIPEVDRMRWMSVSEALRKMSYPHDRDLVTAAGLE